MSAAPFRTKKESTQLYFIQAEGAPPYIKIGIAGNVRRRITDMQLCCPYRLRLLKRVPAPQLERSLHRRFADDRVTGEWFKITDELLRVISEMEGETLLEAQLHEASVLYPESASADHLFIDKRDKAALAAARRQPTDNLPDDPMEWICLGDPQPFVQERF